MEGKEVKSDKREMKGRGGCTGSEGVGTVSEGN